MFAWLLGFLSEKYSKSSDWLALLPKILNIPRESPSLAIKI
jgi:hypothetical protein